MTVPFFIENPTVDHRPMVEVPYEIVMYCDEFTVDADREDLRYTDCVWMHMGYYGTPKHVMKAVRDEYYKIKAEYYRNPRPVFE